MNSGKPRRKNGARLKNAKVIVSLVVLVLLVGLGAWAYYHVSFSFASFRSQLELADWGRIAIGLGCIYLGYVFRGVRWAMLLRHNKKVGLFSLIGTQVIGQLRAHHFLRSGALGGSLVLVKFSHGSKLYQRCGIRRSIRRRRAAE